MFHGTTILAVRHAGKVVLAGDGQVTLGQTIVKSTARKVRRMGEGKLLAGFAGATADAFTLFERMEAKLKDSNGNLARAAVELAKDWRADRVLRRLEAMLLMADRERTLVVSGAGDVLEPDQGAAAVGSGGNFAVAAARALLELPEAQASTLSAGEIARRAMRIAGDLCIYTNHELVIEEL